MLSGHADVHAQYSMNVGTGCTRIFTVQNKPTPEAVCAEIESGLVHNCVYWDGTFNSISVVYVAPLVCHATVVAGFPVDIGKSWNYQIVYTTTLKIDLSGPNSTHALPAGPALPQTARVTRDGVAEANKPVSISMSGAGALGGLSGTTDGNGEVRFSYLPPKTNTTQTAQITATCSDCSNTAQNPITVLPNPQSCLNIGNPIDPASARKDQFETDYTDTAPHALSLTRIYRSTLDAAPAGMGSAWTHGYAGSVSLSTDSKQATVNLGDGTRMAFSRSTDTSPWSASSTATPDQLAQTGDTFTYTRDADNSRWTFTNTVPGSLPILNARLTSITQRNGWTISLTYNAAGQLVQATNAFARSLLFAYNGSGQLGQVTLPDGKLINYIFGSNGAIQSVGYPDNTSKQYFYELPAFPQALTGITNEANQRYATFSYDALGRAIGTQHAGGADNYQLSYPADAASAIPAQGSLVASGQPYVSAD